MKTELTTVPTFNFPQGDPFMQEVSSEHPITVRYFNDEVIELEQEGRTVVISARFLNGLFREIKRHLPEATKHLGRR